MLNDVTGKIHALQQLMSANDATYQCYDYY